MERGVGGRQSHRAGKSEWLTPPEIIAALGPFDLDPCAPVDRPWCTAATHYTIHDDGLQQPWWGFCFMNPRMGARPGSGSISSPAIPAAVSIRRSVGADAITCLDCGYKGQMLKRHISTAHSLSVDEYRTRWSLASDYPMVAPKYAARRSELAKSIGWGAADSLATARDFIVGEACWQR
jgi:hypothetical protein